MKYDFNDDPADLERDRVSREPNPQKVTTGWAMLGFQDDYGSPGKPSQVLMVDEHGKRKWSPAPLTGKDVFTPLTVDDLVQQRGSVYGHPLDDFGRVAKLKAVVADIKDPELRHAAEMVCVKLARLCTTPEHLDSWDDISGYGKTGRMVIEERARRAKP